MMFLSQTFYHRATVGRVVGAAWVSKGEIRPQMLGSAEGEIDPDKDQLLVPRLRLLQMRRQDRRMPESLARIIEVVEE
jgi:hypothetical protein